MIDRDTIDEIFTYHAPTQGDVRRYEDLRQAAKLFAHVILELTPPGPDQSVAIRKLRECVMTANASIALKGKA